MKSIIAIMIMIFSFYNSVAQECPRFSEVQAILNRTLKTPFTIKEIKNLKSFSACKISTHEGETFFLSYDKRFLIEGILLKIPSFVLSFKDYGILKRNVLFSIGSGKEIIVLTNPLCKACQENKQKLTKLAKKFRLSFVMVGFSKKEIAAASNAVCKKKNINDLFNLEENLDVCDTGKLKVWTVSDILRRYGITGTPVFVFPDRKVAVGISDFERMLTKFTLH
ncbi:thioredoxin fold domain-containing protein [Desulfurobacterium thermolithotrophum]|uniref:thioredoxin fold domain-containing protein n=1 Tax=Desulfurobacterium thermolithotrophum TaxID=64160 RepID=UPI0013CF5A09|nr:thioredoxin fold domain-containing protein [Desulfurobacterium thermolithotrophum]